MTLRSCTNAHVIGSLLVGTLLMVQTLCGKFSYNFEIQGRLLTTGFFISWGWYLLLTLPLMVFYTKKGGRSSSAPGVDWIAFVASMATPTLMLAAILMTPFSGTDQGTFLLYSLWWMLPTALVSCLVIASSDES